MSTSNTRPGIEAVEVYFPAQYVAQTALETFNGVSSGKYTIGLGQTEMSFCTDLENTHSVALTVVANLMEKLDLGYEDIGRLSVSSETLVDKSKSIKSVLMQLFEKSDNFDVEGVDYMNACYAGTAGLFDAVSWIQSEDWDGRRALVVCVDIAEYEAGPARPTGGVGAVALLVGPEPIISLERGRASYMKHAYDFYKPYLSSPYPVVDGKVSNQCYLEALDECYQRFMKKRKQITGEETHLEDFDFCLFHSPYNKLVQKSFGRLVYNDFLLYPDKAHYSHLQEYLEIDPKETYSNRKLIKAFVSTSKAEFNEKVAPSTILPKRTGNSYTASLYVSLASLICESDPENLAGKSVLSFSYGSGLCSSIFLLQFVNDADRVNRLREQCSYHHRLEDRLELSPEAFTRVLQDKSEISEFGDHVPQHMVANLYPGTYYIVSRTSNGQHEYSRYDGDFEKCTDL